MATKLRASTRPWSVLKSPNPIEVSNLPNGVSGLPMNRKAIPTMGCGMDAGRSETASHTACVFLDSSNASGVNTRNMMNAASAEEKIVTPKWLHSGLFPLQSRFFSMTLRYHLPYQACSAREKLLQLEPSSYRRKEQ